VIPNTTPIQSVTNGTWAGGSSTVVYTTGTAPVTIDAVVPTIHYNGRFMDWEDIGLTLGLIPGSALTVAAGSSEWGIAFYGIPVPDPCETIRLELQSCLEDLPGKACLPLGHELALCEAYYGED
jgi:hypothetical protein